MESSQRYVTAITHIVCGRKAFNMRHSLTMVTTITFLCRLFTHTESVIRNDSHIPIHHFILEPQKVLYATRTTQDGDFIQEHSLFD
jgi:hypothetical protein